MVGGDLGGPRFGVVCGGLGSLRVLGEESLFRGGDEGLLPVGGAEFVVEVFEAAVHFSP